MGEQVVGTTLQVEELMAYDTRRRRRGFSGKSCPDCGRESLRRLRLRWFQRPLRLVGMRVGRYQCTQCRGLFLIRRDQG